MPPLPVYWYVKPALPIVAIALVLGVLGVLFIPDPLWALSSNDSNRQTFFSGVFAGAVYFYWVFFQAALWIALYRAWRYHADQGIPILRHAIPMVITALTALIIVWLGLSALIWLGARSATQDANLSPWFPLLKSTEYKIPLTWLIANTFLAIGWFTTWARWRTPYRDTFAIVFVALFCHAIAFLVLAGNFASFKSHPIEKLILAALAAYVALPAYRQLRDSETL